MQITLNYFTLPNFTILLISLDPSSGPVPTGSPSFLPFPSYLIFLVLQTSGCTTKSRPPHSRSGSYRTAGFPSSDPGSEAFIPSSSFFLTPFFIIFFHYLFSLSFFITSFHYLFSLSLFILSFHSLFHSLFSFSLFILSFRSLLPSYLFFGFATWF
jgi:hypothetical protein